MNEFLEKSTIVTENVVLNCMNNFVENNKLSNNSNENIRIEYAYELVKEYYDKYANEKYIKRFKNMFDENKIIYDENNKLISYQKRYSLKNHDKFKCELCCFKSHIKTHYNSHINSKKHKLILCV